MGQRSDEQPRRPKSQDGALVLVPAAQLAGYARRVRRAESRVRELELTITALQAQLDGRSEELAAAEAQRDEMLHQLNVAENRIVAERILAEAGVVDLDTASALLAKRVDLGEALDRECLARHVEQLVREKPFLGKGPGPLVRTGRARPAARLAEVAERAMRTGDGKDVAEYLRLKRRLAESESERRP